MSPRCSQKYSLLLLPFFLSLRSWKKISFAEDMHIGDRTQLGLTWKHFLVEFVNHLNLQESQLPWHQKALCKFLMERNNQQYSYPAMMSMKHKDHKGIRTQERSWKRGQKNYKIHKNSRLMWLHLQKWQASVTHDILTILLPKQG